MAASKQPWYKRRLIAIPVALIATGMIRGIVGYADDATGFNNEPISTKKAPAVPAAEKKIRVGMTKQQVKDILGTPQDLRADYWAYDSGSIRFDASGKANAGNFGGMAKAAVTKLKGPERVAEIKKEASTFGKISVSRMRRLNQIYRAKKINDDQIMYAYKTANNDALVRIDDAPRSTQVFLWNDAKQQIGKKAYYTGKTMN